MRLKIIETLYSRDPAEPATFEKAFKIAVVVLIVLGAIICNISCNSTHRAINKTEQSLVKGSSGKLTEVYAMGYDSTKEDNTFHSQFSTGDSVLDNELTIVFDSVANHAMDAPEELQPVTIEQKEGKVTVSTGGRKIKSITAKTHQSGSQTKANNDSAKEVVTVSKIDSGSLTKSDSTHTVTNTTVKTKEVEKKKAPWYLFAIIGAVLLLAGFGFYYVRKAKKGKETVESILPDPIGKKYS